VQQGDEAFADRPQALKPGPAPGGTAAAEAALLTIDRWVRAQKYAGSDGHTGALQGMLQAVRRAANEEQRRTRQTARERARRVDDPRRESCWGTVGDWCGPYHDQTPLSPKVGAPFHHGI